MVRVQGPVPLIVGVVSGLQEFEPTSAIETKPALVLLEICGAVQPAGTTNVTSEPPKVENCDVPSFVNVKTIGLEFAPVRTELGLAVIVPSPSFAAVTYGPTTGPPPPGTPT